MTIIDVSKPVQITLTDNLTSVVFKQGDSVIDPMFILRALAAGHARVNHKETYVDPDDPLLARVLKYEDVTITFT